MLSPSRSVAVIDSCPAAKEGLEVALRRAGMTVAQPASIADWEVGDDQRAAVVAVRGEDDWDAVGRLPGSGHRYVVLVGTASDEGRLRYYCRALANGASAVLPAESSTVAIVLAVLVSFEGMALVPNGLARGLAGEVIGLGKALSSPEIEWLQALSRGDTVSEVAARAGWSQRSMHRHLTSVYRRLGVRNRHEAVALLARRAELGATAHTYGQAVAAPADAATEQKAAGGSGRPGQNR